MVLCAAACEYDVFTPRQQQQLLYLLQTYVHLLPVRYWRMGMGRSTLFEKRALRIVSLY